MKTDFKREVSKLSDRPTRVKPDAHKDVYDITNADVFQKGDCIETRVLSEHDYTDRIEEVVRYAKQKYVMPNRSYYGRAREN